MESVYQNCVTQFDLGFLDQSSVNPSPSATPNPRILRSKLAGRDAYAHLKNRTGKIDNLIEIYLALKATAQDTQRELCEKNELCKNLCIERNNYFDQLNEAENKIQIVENEAKEAREGHDNVKNQFGAINSHVVQLQELADLLKRESETAKEELKNAKEINRRLNLKRDKEIALLNKEILQKERENTHLLKDLTKLLAVFPKRGISSGKSKIKWLREKYSKYMTSNDDTSEDECEAESDNAHENGTSQELQERNDDMISREKYLQDVVRLLTYIPINKKNKADKWLKSFREEHFNHDANDDPLSGAVSDDDMFDSAPVSPFNSENKVNEEQEIEKSSIAESNVEHTKIKNVFIRNTSVDFDNLGSVDTGRGSSLAFSEGEKSIHSPYYSDSYSPPITASATCKCNLPKSDVCTSPIPYIATFTTNSSETDSFKDITSPDHRNIYSASKTPTRNIPKRDICTSPIPFKMLNIACKEAATSPIKCASSELPATRVNILSDLTPNIEVNIYGRTTPETDSLELESNTNAFKVFMSDVAKSSAFDCIESAPSPINCFDEENASPVNVPRSITPHTELNMCAPQTPEIECLEVNRRSSARNDDDADCEVQMILSKMQLNYRILTPLPTTPTKTPCTGKTLTTKAASSDTNASADNNHEEVTVEIEKRLEATEAQVKKLTEVVCCLIGNKNIDLFGSHHDHGGNNTAVQLHEYVSRIISNGSLAEVQQDEICSNNRKMECFKGSVDKKDAEAHVNKTKNGSIDQRVADAHVNKTTKDSVEKRDAEAHVNKTKNGSIDQRVADAHVNKTTKDSVEKRDAEAHVNKTKKGSLDQTVADAHVNKTTIVTEDTDYDEASDNDSYVTDYDDDDLFLRENTYNKQLYYDEGRKKLSKKKTITKLDTLRLQMLPKSKIKRAPLYSIRKRKLKPKTIIRRVKKKATESDSCATLNDKSVYENAVKIMSDLKATGKPVNKVPRVLVDEDCVVTTIIQDTENRAQKSYSEENKEKSVDCQHRMEENKSNGVTISPQEIKSCLKRKAVDHSRSTESKRKLRSSISVFENDTSMIKPDSNKSNEVNTRRTQSVSTRQHTNENLKRSVDNSDCQAVTTKRRSISNGRSSVNEAEETSLQLKDNDSQTVQTKIRCTSTRKSLDSNTVNESVDKINDNVFTVINESDGFKSPSTRRKETVPKHSSEVSNSKRTLRSSSNKVQNKSEENDNHTTATSPDRRGRTRISKMTVLSSDNTNSESNENECNRAITPVSQSMVQNRHDKENNVISYNDLDLFADSRDCNQNDQHNDKNKTLTGNNEMRTDINETDQVYKANGILCSMIDRHGVKRVKYEAKKVPESITKKICSKLEENIAKIISLPQTECKDAMNMLVADLRHWTVRHFLAGFMIYLKDPGRKWELNSKIASYPAPPMTKQEEVLLYVIAELKNSECFVNIVEEILNNIEFALFALNRTPEFDVIESMSHFYALLCRYYRKKSKLRMFILDAMYCIQFKAVTLIKQCLEVWMHILPLAHMGLAKSPMVTCLVYLLHFYKCEDKFNKVQELRFMLRNKYFYEMANEWNETKILEMLRSAIKELKANSVEKKMLRMALIIIAKRQGTKWCQKNLIRKLLLPIIEQVTTPANVKQFCISILGSLLKPYPNDMKVHCEIIANQLIDMLEKEQSAETQEAIVTSLIHMNRHNSRVNQYLLTWNPQKISPEFEAEMKDYVKSRPVRVWKTILSNIVR